ncbi:MAG: pentapeptide repeat-containing protein, partial [Marinobacterium sp.]|nr:pentapeptide repeat-containing protein [Marinobacterium sp.]
VNFSGANFGEGEVNFSGANFGEGKVNLSNTNFGEGEVDFSNTNFGEGEVDFSGANFGEGKVDLFNTNFGEGKVNLSNTKFGEGEVSFCFAQFGKGEVNFSGANFGEGEVNFSYTKFGDSEVDFLDTDFGEGKVSFSNVSLPGRIRFDRIHAEQRFILGGYDDACFDSISFSGATLKSELLLKNLKTKSPIDFRQANLSHSIELGDVEMGFQKETLTWKLSMPSFWGVESFRRALCKVSRWDYFPISLLYDRSYERAVDPEDSSRFRCLKKLAKETDNHSLALDFFAHEMRSAYGHSLTGGKLAMYYAYDKFSDYGRSVVRPGVGLVMLWLFSALLYLQGSPKETATFSDAGMFSLGHLIPVYVGSKEARSNGVKDLFGTVEQIPDWVQLITIVQGLFASIFIFLIALALRNHFRH